MAWKRAVVDGKAGSTGYACCWPNGHNRSPPLQLFLSACSSVAAARCLIYSWLGLSISAQGCWRTAGTPGEEGQRCRARCRLLKHCRTSSCCSRGRSPTTRAIRRCAPRALGGGGSRALLVWTPNAHGAILRYCEHSARLVRGEHVLDGCGVPFQIANHCQLHGRLARRRKRRG